MEITHNNEYIWLKIDNLDTLARTTYTKELFEIIQSKDWAIKYKTVKHKDGEEVIEEKVPQYLRSGKKLLHQVVVGYLWGEDILQDAYSRGMIIEHLNNNGFDCCFSNLYFLKKARNTSKALTFDKMAPTIIDIAAVNMFYNYEKDNFQITIAFNTSMRHKATGDYLNSIKLLYDTEYWVVVQDAEVIVDRLSNCQSVVLSEVLAGMRYKDIRFDTEPPLILSEDEKHLPSGSVVMRDGEMFFIRRHDGNGYFRILSRHYDMDWV